MCVCDSLCVDDFVLESKEVFHLLLRDDVQVVHLYKEGDSK